MSRLDFVRGIKVSASDKVLGNYTRAASSFKDSRGEFGIYIGNAKLIFDMFRPYRPGIFGVIHEHWDRWRRAGGLDRRRLGTGQRDAAGWAWAWQVCRAGDGGRMDQAQRVADAFRDYTTLASGKRPTLACLKRALVYDGVISSGCVAPGTPVIPADEVARFDDAYAAVKAMSVQEIGEPGSHASRGGPHERSSRSPSSSASATW